MALRTASVSGDWSNPATWGGAAVPGNGDEIAISTGVVVTVSDARTIGMSKAPSELVKPTVAVTGGGTTGGSLAAGTYKCVVTNVNANGEGTQSAETAFTVAAGNIPRITMGALPTGVVSRNIYLTPVSGASGTETLQATGVTALTYDLTAAYVAGAALPNGAVRISRTGKLVIDAGGSLRLRGDVWLDSGGSTSSWDAFVVQNGGTLTFDATQAVSPANTPYRFYVRLTSTRAKLYGIGTSGTRCTVQSDTTGGAANGWFDLVGWTGSAATQFTTSALQFDYTDFLDIGSSLATRPAFAYSGDAAMTHFETCRMIRCGDWTAGENVTKTNAWSFANSTFRSSIGPKNLNAAFLTDASNVNITGLRSIAGAVFDQPVTLTAAQKLVTTGAMLFGVAFITGATPSAGSDSEFDGVFWNGIDNTSLTRNVRNSYLYQIGAANQHFIVLAANLFPTFAFEDNIFEAPLADGTGDGIMGSAASTTVPRTISVKRNIVLPGANGKNSCNLANIGVAGDTYTIEHNTVPGHLAGSTRGGAAGVLLGEFGDGSAGEIASLRSNLLWDTAPVGNLIGRNSDTDDPVADVLTAANMTNNGFWNRATTGKCTLAGVLTSTPGYDGLKMTAATLPGAGDVVADPQFVDSTRNLIKWDLSLGGPGTAANALAQLAKRNDPDWNPAYSIAALVAYVKAGFAPTNTAYQGTAHDAGDIGAVAVQSASSPQTASPLAAVCTAVALAAAITLGGVTASPAAAVAASVALAPTVSAGNAPQTVSPSSAVAAAVALAPSMTMGGVTATPGSAVSVSVALSPAVTSRSAGAHDAALRGTIAAKPRLTGTITISPGA